MEKENNIEKISREDEAYKVQLALSSQDFFDYCRPGSVNNWTHPELPEVQAGLVTIINKIKPKRVLDMGSGLSTYSFKKYCTQSEVVSIDDSLAWISKLFGFMEKNQINTDNIFWYFNGNILNSSYLDREFILNITSSPELIRTPGINYLGNQVEMYSTIVREPEIFWTFTDTRQLSENPNMKNVSFILDSHSTSRIISLRHKEKYLNIDERKFKEFDSLGKFDFVHYDFGGMVTRESNLKKAIDMLDRTIDSYIYIDDLHKSDIFYQNLKYIDIVEKTIEELGGKEIKTNDILKDSTGGFGRIYMFKKETDK